MNVALAPISAWTRPVNEIHTLGMDATLAFQPIVDVNSKTIFGYESLARGRHNQSAAEVLASIDSTRLEEFDRLGTLHAIGMASLLNVKARLTINLSSASSSGQLLSAARKAATSNGFFPSQVMFEISCGRNPDHRHVQERGDMEDLFAGCRHHGFGIAIDRFGTPDSGLDLLSTFKPDAVKLSSHLVRNIRKDAMRQASVRGITQICSDLGILVVAVAVETAEECRALRDSGVYLFQGNCFAPPRFEGLPLIPATVWPRIERRANDRMTLLQKPMNRIHIQRQRTTT